MTINLEATTKIETTVEELRFSILAQAIRDLSSTDRKKVEKSIDWIISKDFDLICKELDLGSESLRESMLEILCMTKIEMKKACEDTISTLRASLWQKKTRL